MNKLAIQYVPVDDLKLNPQNPRKNEANVEAVVKSMVAFGWTNPILVRKADKTVIAGHTRLKAAIAEGLAEVPVVYLDLNEVDAKTYMIADNKLTENVDWDLPMLADIFNDLDELDVNMDLTGFSPDEIADIAPATFEPQSEDDAVPDPPAVPVSKTGDLWLLGEHRVLCGDCTIKANVGRLCGSEQVDMVFTDPPYNVQIDYGTHQGDLAEKEWEQFTQKWFGLFRSLANQLVFTPGTGRGLGHPNFKLWYKIAPPDWILCWVKKNAVGHSSLGGFNNWEPLFFYGKPKKKIPQDIYDIPITVQQDVADDEGNKLHPTPKQVKLWVNVIEDFTDQNDTVFDGFLGSGTTLIACEKTGRKCYGMEIDPIYCDVIVKRWEDYTGKKAELATELAEAVA